MTTPPGSSGVRRRDFLKVLGAASATTAAVGCGSGDVDRLIPYLASPDQTVPGVSTYYATTCRECAAACGVIAETRDGRVTKLEGNPAHPLNRGALCARGQSALQGLYNPDRYRGPMLRQGGRLVPTTWDTALRTLATWMREAQGRGAAGTVFVNQHETGSFPAFLDAWLAGYSLGPHISYDAEGIHAVHMANRQVYGAAMPRLDFAAARLVVSFGADFLEGWGASVPQQLDFAEARAKIETAPRFVYIGARRSLTGLNADEWIACRPGSELTIANAILGGMGGGGGATIEQAAQESGVTAATLQRLAAEIAAARPSLVLAGASTANAVELASAVGAINRAAGNIGTTIRAAEGATGFEGMASDADLRAAIDRMNSGTVGLLMVRGANPAYTAANPQFVAAAIAKVARKVSFSSYPDETTELCDLVLPDHHSLESWGDAQPLAATISVQQPAMDPVFNTRATADVLIAVARQDPAGAGRYPMATYREWLMARYPGGQAGFTAALATGVGAGALPARPAPAAAPAGRTQAAPAAMQGDFFVHVYPSPVLGDGRGANKPWLQELPDPVTKICWQSWIEMHPSAAKRLGIMPGDHLEVKTLAGTVVAPAYLYLGIRPDTVAVALGQGHKAYGRYAKDVGVNAMNLVVSGEDAAGGLALSGYKASVRKTGDHSPLVTTEGSARQHGRGIGRAEIKYGTGAAAQFRAAPGSEHAVEIAPQGGPGSGTDAGSHAPPPAQSATQGTGGGHGTGGQTTGQSGGAHHFPGDASHEFLPGLRSPVANDAQGLFGDPKSKDKGMYDPNHWSGMAKRRWAMTVDLARCTGCSACVTACYAENNIPTVGARHQGRSLRPGTPDSDAGWDTRPGANVLKGREMSWIRIERYYEGGAGDSLDFDARFVPMLCQHCGNAPCEPVCPVYATYHAPDGLNVQVYNRCVGTRYCSNNCPYKVRYFNWFGYGEPDRRQYAFPEPLNWQLNPDVTVRGKGVMEKCTFCVQRIREAEHRAASEKRELQPDEFTVACAQACPSRAITFGDAADERWTVARQVHDRRGYHVFEELNTYTAVVYLKKVTHAPPGAVAPALPAGGGH